MREIKFRAWDEDYNNMVYESTTRMYLDGDIEGNRPFILMQYTGLKDRNGKEIYEGDIVEPLSLRYSIISYGEYCNSFNQSSNILGFHLDHLHHEMKHFRKDIIFWVKDGIEIIGNIYENPELLKGQKS